MSLHRPYVLVVRKLNRLDMYNTISPKIIQRSSIIRNRRRCTFLHPFLPHLTWSTSHIISKIYFSFFSVLSSLILYRKVSRYLTNFSSNYSSSTSQSQKKRLLAKAQSEFVIPANGSIVTKQEPANINSEIQYCTGGSSCKDPYHCVPQEQHIVYTTYVEKTKNSGVFRGFELIYASYFAVTSVSPIRFHRLTNEAFPMRTIRIQVNRRRLIRDASNMSLPVLNLPDGNNKHFLFIKVTGAFVYSKYESKRLSYSYEISLYTEDSFYSLPSFLRSIFFISVKWINCIHFVNALWNEFLFVLYSMLLLTALLIYRLSR